MQTKSNPPLRINAKRRQLLLGATTALLGARSAWAGPRDVVIAQVGPFSGPLSVYAKEVHLGASACFASHNARNPGGTQIRLVTRDDQIDPSRTVALYKELAQTERPLAFMYPIAPPNIEAVLGSKLPQQLDIPLLGTVPSMQRVPGADSSHVFHLGLGEEHEIRKIVEHAGTVNLKSLALVYWDAPSGHAAAGAIQKMAAEFGVNAAVRVATAPGGKGDMTLAVQQTLAQRVDAIVCLLPTNEMAEFMRGLRERGNRTVVYGMSFVDSKLLWQMAGSHAEGVCLSQHLPNPFDLNPRRPVVAQYQAAMRAHGGPDARVGSLSFEGYLGSRLLVAAMMKIEGKPSGGKMREALEGLRDLNLGGLVASYGPQQRAALRFIDIGIVSRGGKLMY